MTRRSGPSAKADWLKIAPDRPAGRALWALPDTDASRVLAQGDVTRVSAPQRLALHVIGAPSLSLAPASGAPLVGLTLLLSRLPDAGEESLLPLVTGGVFALSLTTFPTKDDLNRVIAYVRRDDLSWGSAGTATPIFVRRAKWALVDGETGAVFAESVVEGNGTVALSQTLAHELALSLLSTLRGGECGHLARCEVAFRAVDGATYQERSVRDLVDAGPSSAAQTTVVVTTTHASPVERTVVLERPLAHIMREALESRPLDAIVRAVCPGEDGALHPVGHRIVGTRDNAPITRRMGFAAVGQSVAAMPAVLKTSVSARIQAHALAASDLAIRPNLLADRWQIHDLILHPPEAALQNLPVIEGDGLLWRDRVDAERFWYAPELTIVEPLPAASSSDSPFLFSFAVVGHDQQGRPGLEVKVRFTLRMGPSAATQAAWEKLNRPKMEPVPTNGLSIALEVPYRDQAGVSAAQAINATDVRNTDGAVIATFVLTDQWARLAYGALGTQGFQNRPATLNISYVFPAYVPVQKREELLWGGKIAAVDAQRLTAATATARAGPQTGQRPKLLAASAVQLNTPMMVAHHAVLVQPTIVPQPKTYGVRTQGRSARLNVYMPCGKYGALYVQTADPQSPGSDQAIGCRDAWTLGQIQLRLYEPMEVDVGVTNPGFSVFRSLQVPGRFLVLPKAYTISRYEPGDARAYRPAIYLFSNVDANHPERTSCILMATLRPALTPADRHALVDALRTAAHPDPTLEWPTELSVEPRYTWAIPGAGTASQIMPAAVKTPDGFQISLASGVDQILQLKAIVETSGVVASVNFSLADGTNLQSTLSVDLRRINGPWEAGAVKVAISGDRASLTNLVERAADIEDVLTYTEGNRTGTISVEQRIEAGASLDIALPAGTDAAIARYAVLDTVASLEEIRTFIEDVYTNVAFACPLDLTAERIRLSLEGRIVGVPQTATVTLEGNTASAEMAFVLPLTVYLVQPTLQYRVSVVTADGATKSGPWRDWRLDLRGNVIEIGKNELEEV
ncbi:MAG: hypothetical protein JNL68_17045 [Burkholderiales bacterium]|nr:hypothetical protein [Burkholderiales bacterium]